MPGCCLAGTISKSVPETHLPRLRGHMAACLACPFGCRCDGVTCRGRRERFRRFCTSAISHVASVGGVPDAHPAVWAPQTRPGCARRTVRRLRGADRAQHARWGTMLLLLLLLLLRSLHPHLAAGGILMPPTLLQGNRDVLIWF